MPRQMADPAGKELIRAAVLHVEGADDIGQRGLLCLPGQQVFGPPQVEEMLQIRPGGKFPVVERYLMATGLKGLHGLPQVNAVTPGLIEQMRAAGKMNAHSNGKVSNLNGAAVLPLYETNLNFKYMKRIAIFALTAVFFTACQSGGNESAKDAQSQDKAPQEMEQDGAMDNGQDESAAAESGEEVAVKLSASGETMSSMKYDQSRLSVPAGAKVNLTFENTASAEAMIHNAVFIQTGKQMDVINAGMEVGKEGGFVPEDHPAVIAATDLAQPGETVELSFTAPSKPGTYQYICTYPGHKSMKGILVVK